MRKLNLPDYFHVLQLEYITCHVRCLIYRKEKDKLYQRKLMERKKSKIEDIALNNNFKSIFNDKSSYDNYYLQVVGEKGLPNFYYKNDAEKIEFRDRDLKDYYSQQAYVKFIFENKERYGNISTANFEKNEVVILQNDNTSFITLPLTEVSRLL